ncbi:Rcs stress response system protein RcsF [Thalassotalea aquiviva]|uniref:Rcs stress response system protein RcsF n=1 Tax=Thalassotalea aquiviva TaxID=3242415 RepID=UPI00352A0213
MKIVLLIVTLILAGCSSVEFNSNMGGFVKNKVENTVKKGSVKSYTNTEVWELGASQVGYVETNYCQKDFRDREPSKSSLISSLKIKAQKLGGNALVFDSCIVNNSTASCHSHTKCRGMAYLVE